MHGHVAQCHCPREQEGTISLYRGHGLGRGTLMHITYIFQWMAPAGTRGSWHNVWCRTSACVATRKEKHWP